MPITEAARTVNFQQRTRIVKKLRDVLKTFSGKTIGILGLAFKPNTDDIREAPSLDIIRQLIAEGANVRAHDPIAMPNTQQTMSEICVDFIEDVYLLAHDADALVLVTEWEFYHRLELRKLAKQMKTPILIDGRNIFSPQEARSAGFHYIGVGR